MQRSRILDGGNSAWDGSDNQENNGIKSPCTKESLVLSD